MNFDQALAYISQNEEFDMPTGWGQGRTVFGGFVAALLMARAQSVLGDAERKPLSASFTFVGPVQHQISKITVETLRVGGSVTTLEARLWQNDQVQTIMVASFGKARQSAVSIDALPSIPNFAERSTLQKMPYIQGMIPECFQHYDLYWAEGSMPFQAGDSADFGGWFRFKPEVSQMEMQAPHLIALADIWPPGVTAVCRTASPANSLTWHLTFIDDDKLESNVLKSNAWLQYREHTEFAQHGYATEQAQIWDDAGNLLLLSRQTVTVFA